MTALERMIASLNHEESDRAAVWTLIDNSNLMRHFADGEDCDALMTDHTNSEDLLSLTARTCEALGIDVTFLCYKYLMNPFPRDAKEEQTISEYKSEFQTIDDLKAYHPNVPSYEDIEAELLPEFNRVKERLEPHTVLVSQGGCSIEACHGLGFELFSMAMYDAPEELGRIMDAYSEHQRRICQVYADHDLAPAYQVSCDIGFKGTLLFSPDYLRREMIPRLKYEIEPVKNAGMKVVLHSDGDITEMLDDLVDAGIDGINPLETTAGMDLAAVKKRYGKNLTLVGNGHPNVLMFGSRDEIRDDIKRCLRDGAPGGGYFFDTGAGEIMPGLPVENILAAFGALREFGQYPINC
jgi:uroporphyrinogen decarboxylase